MSSPGLAQRIEWIEAGYEFLLAYAAQGRRDDSGSEVRRTSVADAVGARWVG